MMYDKPKGKRKDRQPLPWWALVLILLLGAGVLLWAVATNTPPGVSSITSVSGDIELTATYIIEQATATAQAVNTELTLTASAPEGTQNESVNQESLYLTATYMVVQATQIAMTPQPGS